MATSQGFWSYVHADDEAEGQRISRLARDVASQFELLTGESLELFLDKDALKWGEEWRAKLDSSLATVAFFIPVMTPRYFLSAECRRELQFFARQATRLGVKELVLPLFYADVPAFRASEGTDDLIDLARSFQWEDWLELRFHEPTSEGYRRGVARLAERLVEANRNVESLSNVSPDVANEFGLSSGDEGAPGYLDRVAMAEESLPMWSKTIDAISADIQVIGGKMQDAAAEVQQNDAQGKGFGVRLLVARRLARSLSEPVSRITSASADFTSQLHAVDDGFRALIERAPIELQGDSSKAESICLLFRTIRGLEESARRSLDSTQGMVDSLAALERMSRDLRPTVRQLRHGLLALMEARSVTAVWVGLIDGSGIVCDG